MTRILIVFIVFICLFAVPAHAQVYDHWYTDGELNGYFVLESNDVNNVNYYLEGVLDAMRRFNPELYEKHYKDIHIGNVYDMVTEYYEKNMGDVERSILEVLLDKL